MEIQKNIYENKQEVIMLLRKNEMYLKDIKGGINSFSKNRQLTGWEREKLKQKIYRLEKISEELKEIDLFILQVV